jgi:hypothetical protein
VGNLVWEASYSAALGLLWYFQGRTASGHMVWCRCRSVYVSCVMLTESTCHTVCYHLLTSLYNAAKCQRVFADLSIEPPAAMLGDRRSRSGRRHVSGSRRS